MDQWSQRKCKMPSATAWSTPQFPSFPLSMDSTHPCPSGAPEPTAGIQPAPPRSLLSEYLFEIHPTKRKEIVQSWALFQVRQMKVYKSRIMTQLRTTLTWAASLCSYKPIAVCEVSVRTRESRKLITPGVGIKKMDFAFCFTWVFLILSSLASCVTSGKLF